MSHKPQCASDDRVNDMISKFETMIESLEQSRKKKKGDPDADPGLVDPIDIMRKAKRARLEKAKKSTGSKAAGEPGDGAAPKTNSDILNGLLDGKRRERARNAAGASGSKVPPGRESSPAYSEQRSSSSASSSSRRSETTSGTSSERSEKPKRTKAKKSVIRVKSLTTF